MLTILPLQWHNKICERPLTPKIILSKTNISLSQTKKRKRKDDKWYKWQLSQEASRSERKLKKERFWFQNYRFDDLRKGKECYQIKGFDQLVRYLFRYIRILIQKCYFFMNKKLNGKQFPKR